MVVASFDLDNTLSDRNFDESLWYAAIPYAVRDKEGISKNDAIRKCLDAYDALGPKDLRWYSLNHWLEHFDIIDRKQDILNDLRDRVKLYPDVVPALENLREQGIPIILVSNAEIELVNFKLEAEGISGFFKKLFSATSHYKCVAKDENVFSDVACQLGVKPGEIYHVGDHEQFDFVQPKRAGVNAYLLDRSGEKKGGNVVSTLAEFVEVLPI